MENDVLKRVDRPNAEMFYTFQSVLKCLMFHFITT